MYKIAKNTEQFDIINNKAHELSPDTTDKYSEITKHCNKDLYAIPLIDNILKSYNIEFITDEWLTTDIIDTLPIDWTWQNLDRPVRMTMNTIWIYQTMINDVNIRNIMNRETAKNDITEEKFIHIDNVNTVVYFNTINEADYDIVKGYIENGDIIVDNYNV
jgi:hypothetical protein